MLKLNQWGRSNVFALTWDVLDQVVVDFEREIDLPRLRRKIPLNIYSFYSGHRGLQKNRGRGTLVDVEEDGSHRQSQVSWEKMLDKVLMLSALLSISTSDLVKRTRFTGLFHLRYKSEIPPNNFSVMFDGHFGKYACWTQHFGGWNELRWQTYYTSYHMLTHWHQEGYSRLSGGAVGCVAQADAFLA